MKKYHDPEFCTVIVKDGYNHLKTPSGEIISGIIFTRVHDEVNCMATCIVKLHVNLEESPSFPEEIK